MNAPVPQVPSLVRVAAEGARARKAVRVLDQERDAIVASLKKAMPFLSKKGSDVQFEAARAVPLEDLLQELEGPVHVTPFVAKPGDSRGLLAFDGAAAALVLDGVLGGNGTSAPTLGPRFSKAQLALMARIAGDVLRTCSDLLGKNTGLSLEGDEKGALPAEAALIVGTVILDRGSKRGRVAVAVAKDAMLQVEEEASPPPDLPADPKVLLALSQVELDVLVELGHVRISLSELSALRVGSTLRTETPVSGVVIGRVAGKPLLEGKPTVVSGQLAIRLERGTVVE